MTRPRQQAYRCDELSALARQLLYSPPDLRAKTVALAERLHDEIEPDKNYPIDFVVFRLTQRRIPPREHVMLVGEAVRPDLRLLIDMLSRSIRLISTAEDPAMTTAELAQTLGVSTKTIARWRGCGLRWRWGIREGEDKPAVLMTESALRAFDQSHPGKIAAASAFSQMSGIEKQALIDRARRLTCATDAPPQRVLAHLAKRAGRSTESLRRMILEYDAQNPGREVFADRSEPLTAQQKRVIDRAYRRGVNVGRMCQRFGKTRSTIYRAIHEARAERIASIAIHYVHSPTFDRDDADEVFTQPLVRHSPPRHLGERVIQGLPLELQPIYNRPIEPDELVRSLIVRYNFLKYRALSCQQVIMSGAPRAGDLNRFEQLAQRITKARGEIISAVLPMTLSIVLRHISSSSHDRLQPILHALTLGHRVLLEEIDRYDPSVAHPFESVFTNRLLRILAQSCVESTIILETHAIIKQLLDAGLEV